MTSNILFLKNFYKKNISLYYKWQEEPHGVLEENQEEPSGALEENQEENQEKQKEEELEEE